MDVNSIAAFKKSIFTGGPASRPRLESWEMWLSLHVTWTWCEEEILELICDMSAFVYTLTII